MATIHQPEIRSDGQEAFEAILGLGRRRCAAIWARSVRNNRREAHVRHIIGRCEFWVDYFGQKTCAISLLFYTFVHRAATRGAGI